LSSRRKKVEKGKKPELKKDVKAKPVRPLGKAPQAMVRSRHGAGFVTRLGRGFSVGELAGTGLSPSLASDWGLRLDPRRRSVVDGNVASLKSWSSHPRAAKRVEGVAKEVEEEIGKVGKEIKKEAAKVEKEAEKVEREVKGEAVKAEKTVRRKSKPKKKAES
jgi:ribosomal protein L13E